MDINDAYKMLSVPNALLVLGNGFDKHCGLASSFSDFFKRTLLDEDENPIFHKVFNNLWYIIFYYAFMMKYDNRGSLVKWMNNKDPLWMDVEGYINNCFRSKPNLHMQMPIYNFVNTQLVSGTMQDDDISMSGPSTCLSGDDKNQCYIIKQKIVRLKSKHTFSNVEDLFMYELNRFEEDFRQYLSKEVDTKHETYLNEARSFLLDYNYLDNYGSNELFVYSFNYTKPFKGLIDNKYFNNVHGTLEDKNIIIGIDNDDNHLLPSCNKFRKIQRRRIVDINENPLPDSLTINKVYFYGCSLGPLDYTYYDYIFDKYGLGKTKTEFVFLYSLHGKNDSEKNDNRERYISNCESAIKKYLKKQNLTTDVNKLNLDNLVKYVDIEKLHKTKN